MGNNISLCNVCNAIDFDAVRSSSGFDLYAKASSLRRKATAANGCPLCAMLWQRLRSGRGVEARESDPVKLYATPPTPENEAQYWRRVMRFEGKRFNPDTYDAAYPRNSDPLPMAELVVISGSQEVLEELVWAPKSGWQLVEPGYRDSVAAQEAGFSADDIGWRSSKHPFFVQGKLRVMSSLRDPLIEGIRSREIGSDQDSKEAFRIIRTWIASCQTSYDCGGSHSACHRIQAGKLPARVIDVGPSDGSQEPRLLVTSDHQDEKSRQNLKSIEKKNQKYICLSYCWGRDPVFTTTSTNLEAHKRKIVVNKLPQTIKDAILITRSLTVQYLWVDALCIIQGSDAEAVRDWQQESAKMNEIYSGAFLTIVAASSKSVHEGVFRKQSNRSTLGCIVPFFSLREQILNASLIVCKDLPKFTQTLEEPLHSRGWTLQERHLSPRVLYYNTQQISWECRSFKILESEPGDKRQSWHSHVVTGQLPGREISPGVYHIGAVDERLVLSAGDSNWSSIVEDFTSRNLSRESDKLPAISGLAQAHQKGTGDEYLAGLWKSAFCDGLLWDHASTHRYPRLIPKTRPSCYRAPSWSWASVDGNVRYWGSLRTQGPNDRTSLLSHDITLAGADPFGQVLEARIKVRGPLKRARFKIKKDEITLVDFLTGTEVASVCLDAFSSSQPSDVKSISKTEPWCLLVRGKIAGLVVASSGNREHEFRRLGIFSLVDFNRDLEWFANCEEQDLIMV